MPNTHATLTSLFTDIANAIRTKTGSSDPIVADNFPTAIANIPTGSNSNWMGKNPTLVASPHSETATLNSIGFSSWTPSTTASTLRAASTLSAINISGKDYNYFVVETFVVNYVYNTSGSATYGLPMKYIATYVYPIFLRADSTTAYDLKTPNKVSASGPAGNRILKYTDVSNGATKYATYNYGVYETASTPTIGSATSSTQTLTIKVPAIDVRANATYCKAENVGSIDGVQSTFTCKVYVYRVDMDSSWWQGSYLLSLDLL